MDTGRVVVGGEMTLRARCPGCFDKQVAQRSDSNGFITWHFIVDKRPVRYFLLTGNTSYPEIQYCPFCGEDLSRHRSPELSNPKPAIGGVIVEGKL